jgi:hypothetical protein
MWDAAERGPGFYHALIRVPQENFHVIATKWIVRSSLHNPNAITVLYNGDFKIVNLSAATTRIGGGEMGDRDLAPGHILLGRGSTRHVVKCWYDAETKTFFSLNPNFRFSKDQQIVSRCIQLKLAKQ